MKNINILISDIYELLEARDGRFSSEIVSDLAESISSRLETQLGEGSERTRSTLSLSKMGPRCPCALWYSVRHPEMGEPLQPWAVAKFSLGHIHEAWGIALCKAAGHTVTGEQDELWVDGVPGHRDAVVDGCIVDFKSCSTRSFQKFKDKSIVHDDPFGYLDQVDGYLVGSLDDDLVQVKDKGYIFAMDKTLGHMVLYEHRLKEASIRTRIQDYKDIVALPSPPRCTCNSIEDGKSGNRRFDTRASYSPYKFCCNPNIRTFLYADGPRYLTHVAREPDVPEIDREGNFLQSGRTTSSRVDTKEKRSNYHKV